jgi:hypothetical protein
MTAVVPKCEPRRPILNAVGAVGFQRGSAWRERDHTHGHHGRRWTRMRAVESRHDIGTGLIVAFLQSGAAPRRRVIGSQELSIEFKPRCREGKDKA